MSLTAQLNNKTYIASKLKAELAKIKAKLNGIRKQLLKTHLSLTNEMRWGGKSNLGPGALFQRKFPLQNLKTKNSFRYKKLKTKKNLRDHLKYLTFDICIFNPNPKKLLSKNLKSCIECFSYRYFLRYSFNWY